MQSTEVIKILTENQLDLEQMGIKSLALFGSVARNEAKPDSDIDLLIEFYPDKSPRGLAFFDVQYHLEKILGKNVDLVQPNYLKSRIRDRVFTQAITIFPSHLNYQNLVVNMTDKNLGKDWRLYIDDMLNSALRIQNRTQNLTFDDFLNDEDVIDIVERKVITIGEAADKILKEFPDITSANSQIPWHQMKGMRNRLVHDYDNVNYEKLWLVVVEDIAPLITELQNLLLIDN